MNECVTYGLFYLPDPKRLYRMNRGRSNEKSQVLKSKKQIPFLTSTFHSIIDLFIKQNIKIMSLYKQMNFRVMDTDLIKGMDSSNSVKTNIYYLNFITCDRFQEQCSKEPFQFMDNQLNV